MRRARPGDAPRGNGKLPGVRRSVGEERALTSVGAGADFGDGHGDARGEGRADGDAARGDRMKIQDQGAGTGTVEAGTRPGAADEERVLSRLWHITLSVSGREAPLKEVRRGLEQLAHDHPFLLTSRYANDHAEIRYWEEARDLHDAAAVALRLWGEHRSTANLPPWEIVGLEVIDRQTYHQRVAEGYGPPAAARVGVHPF
ncbi:MULTISPECIES: hypothetical protein [unclassified Streptomyces]|uniref:hypothetical protein n=1 Tax=unclassified Streptomyces TaxID=2593676 RepID=UPI0033AA13AE